MALFGGPYSNEINALNTSIKAELGKIQGSQFNLGTILLKKMDEGLVIEDADLQAEYAKVCEYRNNIQQMNGQLEDINRKIAEEEAARQAEIERKKAEAEAARQARIAEAEAIKLAKQAQAAQQAVASAAATCPTCGKAVIAGAAFCGNCGSKLEAPKPATPAPAFCGKCGNSLIPGAMFCNNCGAKVGQ